MINFREKSYTTFSAIERVNLTIAALNRGDADEITTIRHSFPLVEYKGIDREYIFPLEDLNKIIGLFCLICESYSRRILLVRAGLNAYISTYKCADQCTLESEVSDEAVILIQGMLLFQEIVQDSTENIKNDIAYIKSVYLALEQFCDSVGISYKQVVKWLDIPSINDLPIGQDQVLIEQVEARDEDTSELKKIIQSHWRGKISTQ